MYDNTGLIFLLPVIDGGWTRMFNSDGASLGIVELAAELFLLAGILQAEPHILERFIPLPHVHWNGGIGQEAFKGVEFLQF